MLRRPYFMKGDTFMYVVTGCDLNKMLDEVGKITGNASDARATAPANWCVSVGWLYWRPCPDYRYRVKTPALCPVQYAVLVPYTAALSAVGEAPIQSMSEGGDTVTYATTSKPRMVITGYSEPLQAS